MEVVQLSDMRPGPETLLWLEQRVNDGSPSGFSFLNTPGPGYRASDLAEFQVPVFRLEGSSQQTLGDDATLERDELPVHPEMESLVRKMIGREPHRRVPGVATSSGRTIFVRVGDKKAYLKVAYNGVLGRLTRHMTRSQVVSALEVSSALEAAIVAGMMAPSFHIYREHFGLYFPESAPLGNCGYVERALRPFPEFVGIEVPAFSLFARPPKDSTTILSQIVGAAPAMSDPEGFFGAFVDPLLDLYFAPLVATGLQPEAHAQNVTFLLGDDFTPRGVALRDMESVDKDTLLIERALLASEFTATGYKFLEPGAYNYQIMHSFMFDFKFGKYLLEPLVDEWSKVASRSALSRLEAQIRERSRQWLARLPHDFLPEAEWYDYAPLVYEGSGARPYESHPNPRFR